MTAQIIQMDQHNAAIRRNLSLGVRQFKYVTTFDLEASDYPDLEALGFDECEHEALVSFGFWAAEIGGEWEVFGSIERVEFLNAITRQPVHVVVDLHKFQQVITAAEVRRLEEFYSEDVASALQTGESELNNFIRG